MGDDADRSAILDVVRQPTSTGDVTGLVGPLEITDGQPVLSDERTADADAPGAIAQSVEAESKPGSKPKSDGAVTVVGRPEEFNPSLPNLVVFDSFATKDVPLTFKEGENASKISHGEISAKAAEAQGFQNVFRVERGALELDPDTIQQILFQPDKVAALATLVEGELASGIEALEHKVNSGEIPLGKGDAVIMSFGNGLDPTFAEASTRFGVDLTPENLASKRSEFLERLKTISQDPNHPEFRMAANILRVNDALGRLQEKGIHVIHASGNQGPERFSPGFMNAFSQVKALRPSGKVWELSADHSLAVVAGQGHFQVHLDPQTSDFLIRNSDLQRPIKIADRVSEVAASSEDLEVGLLWGTSFAHITLLPDYRRIFSAVKEGRKLDGQI